MDYDAIEVHFGEIWLKGGNRSMFVSALHRNILSAMRGMRYVSLARERDRFMVYTDRDSDYAKISGALARVPGISWFAPIVTAKPTLQDIMKKAGLFAKRGPVRVVAKRAFKGHKFDSYELVSRMIKASQSGKLGLTLDKDAGNVLYINVVKEKAMLHLNKSRGVGGLPVGTSGKAVVLLSGGIDSPVAAFYAMKRGLLPVYVHFHTFPENDEALKSKIPKLVGVLSGYSNGAKVYYMPAHQFQAAVMKIPTKYELVVYKRFMYKVAERIAKLEGADAIVTGESIGQVASQTIDNMLASQGTVKPLILRPLSGFDKEEIIAKARELGTYDLSIQEYRDVCSIKIKRPATRTNAALISRLYAACKLATVVGKTVRASKQQTVS